MQRDRDDTSPHPSPDDVARRWISAVAERDKAALDGLYEIGAAVHTIDEVVLDRERIIETSCAMPLGADPVIESGAQGRVTVVWPAEADGSSESVRLRVRHGKIVEQRHGLRHAVRGGLAAVPMNMSTAGEITTDEHDLVWDVVDRLVSSREQHPSHVDVRLSRRAQRGPDPVSLRITMDLPGGSVRASAEAGDVRAASQIVEKRLKEALRRRVERRFESFDHGTIRLDPEAPRIVGGPQLHSSEREVVRHKSVSPGPSTLEEATFDLVSMGYDFFLYVDAESGRDALVSTRDDGGVDSVIDPPVVSFATARERLDVGHERLVFYTDERSGRGHVLYRRRDGHYGLIVPADD